jgi:exodeoxyribonuclease VII large subunit
MQERLRDARAALAERRTRLLRMSPRTQLVDAQLRNAQLVERLHRAMRHILALETRELGGLQRSLQTLSPRATLSRGYAIVRRPDGSVVMRAADVDGGDPLLLEVHHGVIAAQVQEAD